MNMTVKANATNSKRKLVETMSMLAENASAKPLLQQANDLINGPRQSDYGDTLLNFAQIAMIWNGLLSTKLGKGNFITAEDVALCMMGLKMARLAKFPDHYDSILDVAGYAGCYDKLQQERIGNHGNLVGNTVDYRSQVDTSIFTGNQN
jgi:hypothetical protein